MTAGFSSKYTINPTSCHGKYESKDIISNIAVNVSKMYIAMCNIPAFLRSRMHSMPQQ